MKYFAYIRVSTTRRGEHAVSLQHPRDAIERTRTFGIVRESPVINAASPGGVLLAASGNFLRLPRRILADYDIGNATHRRGTPGVLCHLEKGVQGGTLHWRRAPARPPAYRTLRPAIQTSAVGEEVFRAA